jgi:hypothetical protein
MQIQLKQTEIITALKQYISSQGIDLTGKDVVVTFTAGRKESGISAEMDIEENALPDFAEADDNIDPQQAAKVAVLSMVISAPVVLHPAAEPIEAIEAAVNAGEPVKTTSLFS